MIMLALPLSWLHPQKNRRNSCAWSDAQWFRQEPKPNEEDGPFAKKFWMSGGDS